jgi:kynureninase
MPSLLGTQATKYKQQQQQVAASSWRHSLRRAWPATLLQLTARQQQL